MPCALHRAMSLHPGADDLRGVVFPIYSLLLLLLLLAGGCLARMLGAM